jgi:hypothetical protein
LVATRCGVRRGSGTRTLLRQPGLTFRKGSWYAGAALAYPLWRNGRTTWNRQGWQASTLGGIPHTPEQTLFQFAFLIPECQAAERIRASRGGGNPEVPPYPVPLTPRGACPDDGHDRHGRLGGTGKRRSPSSRAAGFLASKNSGFCPDVDRGACGPRHSTAAPTQQRAAASPPGARPRATACGVPATRGRF